MKDRLKVLVAGASGQVGSELVLSAPDWAEVVAPDSNSLDISSENSVADAVSLHAPDLIINAAAYTAVDAAESDEARATQVNSDGPANLGRAAARLGIPVFHISTDYVFSGDAIHPYDETASASPMTAYGRSKLAGEQRLVMECERHLILRTSWVFSAHGSNFVKTMLRLGRERSVLGIVADQQGCPTAAHSIAVALWRLAQRWYQRPASEFVWGTFHFAGTPATDWHAFAQEIFLQASELGLVDPAPVVDAIATQDYPTPARRPAYSVLDCSRLRLAHGIDQPQWGADLGEVLATLGKVPAAPG